MNSDTALQVEPGAYEGSRMTIGGGKKTTPSKSGSTSGGWFSRTASTFPGKGNPSPPPPQGMLEKLSSINPCCLCICPKFKLSLACCAIAIYTILISLTPLIVGVGKYEKKEIAEILKGGNDFKGLPTLTPLCGIFGLLSGLILLVVSLYDMLKPDKTKLVNKILAILCWVSCVFLLLHFSLALASLLTLLKTKTFGTIRIFVLTKSLAEPGQMQEPPPSGNGNTESSLTLETTANIVEHYSAFLILTTIHSSLCVYFLICVYFLGFRFLQKGNSAK